MKKRLPPKILTYFWGDNPDHLEFEKHKDYIAKTILQKGDLRAVNWLSSKVDNKYLLSLVSKTKLDPKSANFWKIYLN